MDVKFPAEVLAIIKKAASRYPSDIVKATDDAENKIRALPDFDEIVHILIRAAIQEQVYEARHAVTRQIKYETGQYGGPAKVVSGESEGVKRAAISCYQFRIGSTILGLVLGEELLVLAAAENAIGNGHLYNAELLTKLKPLVPEGKRVQDAVSEKKLRAIMESIRKKYEDDAA